MIGIAARRIARVRGKTWRFPGGHAPKRLQQWLEMHVGQGCGPQETSPQGSSLWEVAKDGRHAGLVDASQTRVKLGSD